MSRFYKVMVLVLVCAMVAVQVMAAVLRSFASLALAEPWWEAGKSTAEVPTEGVVLVRELPNLYSTSADALEILLIAESTFTNPKINGQTYTGTFVNVSVELIGVDARSVTIRHTMMEVSAPTNTTTLAALEYTQMDKNEILDVFSLTTGEKDTRALQWRNINPAQRATLYAIADSNLVSQFATGYLYVDREFKDEVNGTASFSILFQKAAWDVWSGEDIDSWTFMRRGNPGRDRASLQKTWTGIAISNALAGALAVATNTNFITSGYAVTDSSWTDNGDESANIVQMQVQTNLTSTTTSKTIAKFSTQYSTTDENMAAAVTHATNRNNGVIVTTKADLNQNGLYVNTYSTNTATADAEVRIERTITAFETNDVLTAVNETTREGAVTNTSQTAGVILTASSEETDAGVFNNELRTRTAVKGVAAASAIQEDLFNTRASARTSGATNATTPTFTSGADIVVSAQNTKDDFGLYTVSLETNTVKYVPSARVTTSITAFYAETNTVHRHTNTAATVAALTDGVIQTVTSTKDATGDYDTQILERAPAAADSYTQTNITEFGGVTVTKYHNQTSIPSADAVGTVLYTNTQVSASSVSGSKNPHGRYDATKTSQWHDDADTIGTNGVYTWRLDGPQTYRIDTWTDGKVTAWTRYWEHWNHSVQLYDTSEAAWDARSDDTSKTNSVKEVGRFSNGIYYYHTVSRGTNDQTAGYWYSAP